VCHLHFGTITSRNRYNSANLCHISLRPTCKLAAVPLLSRPCSRPRLWTHIIAHPPSRFLSTSTSATKYSSFARVRDTVSRTRPSHGQAELVIKTPTFKNQLRYCSSEASSTFVAMASDRDILPAWYVTPLRTWNVQNVPKSCQWMSMAMPNTSSDYALGSSPRTTQSPFTTSSSAAALATKALLQSTPRSRRMMASMTLFSMRTSSRSRARN
jgi:hypothetical protein